MMDNNCFDGESEENSQFPFSMDAAEGTWKNLMGGEASDEEDLVITVNIPADE